MQHFKATISANGTYYLTPANLQSLDMRLDTSKPFTMGAAGAASGNTATVQLVGEISGAVTNLDSAMTPTFATPVAWPGEYTLTGRRAVVVSGIVGSIILEVSQP